MTDVLIVGAGPVGLFLANECARWGLHYRVLESRSTQSEHSKALAIFPRTLEVFAMAGIAEPFLLAANRVDTVSIFECGHEIARIPFHGQGTPYGFVAMVPQNVTEEILVRGLSSAGGRIEYDTTLNAITQTNDRVTASIERNGTTELIEAKYVVGCDGAHSTVRSLLDIEFEGGEYAEQYMLADVLTNDGPADVMHLCPSDRGPLAVFPISRTRRRLVAMVREAQGDSPSLDDANAVLRERAPRDIVARSVVWSGYFRIHHRMVQEMRLGRVFLAGDAAHIHSPFGGQGMNTGLQDAWNLGWKLALACKGLASELLLESYSAERVPVVKSVIATTHALTQAFGARSSIARHIRDTLIPAATSLPAIRNMFVQRLSNLGIAYGGSPIVEGSGRRVFSEALLKSNLLGKKYFLIAPNPALRSDVEARFPSVVATLPVQRLETLLVRPDGYVAYESVAANGGSASKAIEEVLERQVISTTSGTMAPEVDARN